MLAMAMATLFLLAIAKEPLIGLGVKAGTVPRYHKAMYVLWGVPLLCGILVAISILVQGGVQEGNWWYLLDPGPILGILSIAILVGAIVMEVLARYQLGKDFSLGAAVPQEIASNWLYRLENPIYDALALQVLALGIWWPPLLFVGVTMQLLISAGGVRGERIAIEAKFGRYNRGWESRLWDGLVATVERLERFLPPPQRPPSDHPQ